MFEIANEKLLTTEVLMTQWSHLMDLLAILYKNNVIEIFRISYKIKRVFQPLIEKVEILCMQFSPDSH